MLPASHILSSLDFPLCPLRRVNGGLHEVLSYKASMNRPVTSWCRNHGHRSCDAYDVVIPVTSLHDVIALKSPI